MRSIDKYLSHDDRDGVIYDFARHNRDEKLRRTAWILLYVGIVSFVIATCMLFSLAAHAAPSTELTKMQDQMFGHTVQLGRYCSGSIVSSERDKKDGKVSTFILTAKHCVQSDAAVIDVIVPVYAKNRIVKEEVFKARLHGKFYKADLALYKLVDENTFFDHLAKLGAETDTLTMGENVWTVGYPVGMALTVTPGVFGSYEVLDFPTDGVEYIRSTPNIAPGNSGGALYHLDDKGDYVLIGVTTAGLRGFAWVSFYTPIDAIREYLKVAIPAKD